MDVRVGLWRKLSTEELMLWTVVLEKTLERPLDCKELHQSILKKISPGCSLEGLMLKLKLQYFGHLIWRADSFEKTLMLGKTEGRRRRGRQRMKWLDGITNSVDMGLGGLRQSTNGQGGLVCCGSWGRKKSDTTEWLNWTVLRLSILFSQWKFLHIVNNDSSGENGSLRILGYRLRVALDIF